MDWSHKKDLKNALKHFETLGKNWVLKDIDPNKKLKTDENGKIREITRSLIALIVVFVFSLILFLGVVPTQEMQSIMTLILGGIIGYYFKSSRNK